MPRSLCSCILYRCPRDTHTFACTRWPFCRAVLASASTLRICLSTSLSRACTSWMHLSMLSSTRQWLSVSGPSSPTARMSASQAILQDSVHTSIYGFQAALPYICTARSHAQAMLFRFTANPKPKLSDYASQAQRAHHRLSRLEHSVSPASAAALLEVFSRYRPRFVFV